LALGGGAARGFAHVGVIAALESAGIVPDIVTGTSAGSVVGALYASGMSAGRLRRTALALEEGGLGDWSLSGRGLLRGQALQDLVNRLLENRPIERFPRTFAATATDLYNGRLVLLRSGNPGRAVRASSAVPGLFQPVAIDGREYVDGGVASPVPVRAARELGADRVIAVDISAKPVFQQTDSMAGILLQTFAIMGQRLAAAELREADWVIAPAVGDLSGADFASRELAMAEGERAARGVLPVLLDRLAPTVR
jgi:NTE family protein